MPFNVSWIDLEVGSQMQSTNASLNNLIANVYTNCQAPNCKKCKIVQFLALGFLFQMSEAGQLNKFVSLG